jgi:hypothetical protein
MEFYYWCRSIIDSCGRIPVSLRADLDGRCPGFLESERQYESAEKRGDRSASLRLLAWIEDHFFAEAKNKGWFNAIRYYAARDLRCLRVVAYWREFVRESKNAVCSFLPFQDWLRSAAQSDPRRHLTPELREIWELLSRVTVERLHESLDRYLEWQAFAYWVRSPLESDPGNLPSTVDDQLRCRCPGFLEHDAQLRSSDSPLFPRSWFRLMDWIQDHFFSEEKASNWFDAVAFSAENHPRSQRTIEYWLEWDDALVSEDLGSYPSFQEWRARVDSYVPSK